MSTIIVGLLAWLVLDWLGIGIPLIYCLLFGALISPTDPIAVMATLKSVGIAKSIETKIAGESLFNDGVGVVIFLDHRRAGNESGPSLVRIGRIAIRSRRP